jgi:tetratricopeptide (TPR) repeat protein
MRGGQGRLAVAALLLLMATGGGDSALAIESDPLPVPSGGSAATAASLYNEGVALLLARQFAPAQRKFEAALALNEGLAEAHNNLAFALRMQGRENQALALKHYGRALELKPGLAQAYHYRGALFVQQGELARARQDLERLRALDPRLAAELQRLIDGGAAPAERSGIAAQYD